MALDKLEEDLNNTRQTLQAVVERDTLSETRKLQDKLALAQDELILLNATVEEEFKKNDELREELKKRAKYVGRSREERNGDGKRERGFIETVKV